MTSIIPVPTTRVSDLLISQRMLSQMQSDQQAIFRLQNQLTTGRRISLASEDAPAALRAITLQSLIERKQQVSINLQTNQSYLGATDTALGNVSALLADIRGAAISVVGTTSSDTQREAIALEVERAIQQLVDVGNQQFRGRYLFAGARTNTQPFVQERAHVDYRGDEKSLYSYSDLDVLFETNMPGSRVFGAISEPVRGTMDLNPVVTEETRLADLRGGRGVGRGSVEISDGWNSVIVDLSSASTVGDVVELLEANPPAGRAVIVDVTDVGLSVSLDTVGGGTLTIREVGGGTTANELGILHENGFGVGPVVGADLDPRLSLTTRLENLLGTRARGTMTSAGTTNNLDFIATSNGPEFNGVTIKYVDDDYLRAGGGLTAGNEVAEFHETAVAARASLTFETNVAANNDILLTATEGGTVANNVTVNFAVRAADAGGVQITYAAGVYTVSVEDGVHSASDVVNAINANGDLGGRFTAALDTTVDATNDGSYVFQATDVAANAGGTFNTGSDANTLVVRIDSGVTTANQVMAAVNAEGTFRAEWNRREALNDGGGAVIDSYNEPTAVATTAGGSGEEFDFESGIQINNGGESFDISMSTVQTVEDLLNVLNGAGAGIFAEINATSTGIDLRSRWSGQDFTVGETGGRTATQLGVRSFTSDVELASLNHGFGVHDAEGVDFVIRRADGIEMEIDVAGATTVQDVLDRINNHPANLATPNPIVAQMAANGNGIELVNDGPPGSGALTVERRNLSQVAEDLGLIPTGLESFTAQAPGVAPTTTLTMSGANNDLVISGIVAGTGLNDVRVSVTNSGLGPGNGIVTFNPTDNTLVFDVDPSTTATEMIDILANNPLAGTLFTASLAPADGAPNSGAGAVDLAATANLAGGEAPTLTGTDVNPREVDGVFTGLIRLRDALRENDVLGIERAIGVLDKGMTTVNFARAELGARQRSLDVLQVRLESEEVDLQASLSLEIDVDITEAISNFTARQASFQASLQTAAQTLKTSLLDYL
jgi:flagellar hook-associated protein 3 FlgL